MYNTLVSIEAFISEANVNVYKIQSDVATDFRVLITAPLTSNGLTGRQEH